MLDLCGTLIFDSLVVSGATHRVGLCRGSFLLGGLDALHLLLLLGICAFINFGDGVDEECTIFSDREDILTIWGDQALADRAVVAMYNLEMVLGLQRQWHVFLPPFPSELIDEAVCEHLEGALIGRYQEVFDLVL